MNSSFGGQLRQSQAVSHMHKKERIVRACDGCLDTKYRRRTRQSAISFGKLIHKRYIRRFPNGETWLGWYLVAPVWTHRAGSGNLANWNILVARGRESKNDSPSSGERTGNSPNLILLQLCLTEFDKPEQNMEYRIWNMAKLPISVLYLLTSASVSNAARRSR